jgi:hypothetical protein
MYILQSYLSYTLIFIALLMLLPVYIPYCFWLLPRSPGEWKLPVKVFNRMELFILFVRNLLAELFQFHLAMFSRFRNAIFNAVGGLEQLPVLKDSESNSDDRSLAPKFPYSRQHFSAIPYRWRILVSADHHIRPIIVPRDISKLPWNSGYAE